MIVFRVIKQINDYEKQKSFLLLEKCTSDPVWVYDMYLHVANTKNNIHMPFIQYVRNFNNYYPVKETRRYKIVTLNVRSQIT